MTADILRAIAVLLQAKADAAYRDSLEWACYEDAACALADLADYLSDERG